mmetsp:Transcript_15616/g.28389  ORF Transcript_15616/g.28389 Transcript_15616/m.28389 type:complete len:241 (-) Transcript_15616:680-1402(-)
MKGPCCTPSTFCPARRSPVATAISVAPPPGRSFGSKMTFRTTCMASDKFRSISFSTSLLPPRSIMVHALGSLHSSKKAKYSSPILRISKRPQFVPMSLSWISSVRDTIVAPVARATRLLSVFLNRRNAVILALAKKCCARSLTPFSVITISGLKAMISMHIFSTYSSSILSIVFQSSSSVISTFVCDSPFLYSRGESSKRIRGFSILRLILLWVTSLLNITPLSTHESEISPPGIFSTFA